MHHETVFYWISGLVLGVAAALFHGSAFVLYAIRARLGHSSPKSASWALWAFLATVNALTFRTMSGDVATLQFFTGSVACVAVFVYMWAIGKLKWPEPNELPDVRVWAGRHLRLVAIPECRGCQPDNLRGPCNIVQADLRWPSDRSICRNFGAVEPLDDRIPDHGSQRGPSLARRTARAGIAARDADRWCSIARCSRVSLTEGAAAPVGLRDGHPTMVLAGSIPAGPRHACCGPII